MENQKPNSIKIENNRQCGSLFHYAHFLFDCLFTEIINDVYNYDEVIRKKILGQTIGNFVSIYNDVMQTKNIELPQSEYDNLKVEKIVPKRKESYQERKYFDKVRDFIFGRYCINPLEYDASYPEVILIERSNRVELISDEELKKINLNVTNGKERREIVDIEKVDQYLQNKYSNRFKKIMLEHMPFVEQIRYFNNAKMIISAHGSAMSNMLFCKEHTTVIQASGGRWDFFGVTADILNIDIYYCDENTFESFIKKIDECKI
jgi:hypothetical protein